MFEKFLEMADRFIKAVERIADAIEAKNSMIQDLSEKADLICTEDLKEKVVDEVPEVDSQGLPWDARIHSSNHKLTSAGVWQRRRGVSDTEFDKVMDELVDKAPVETETAEETTIGNYAMLVDVTGNELPETLPGLMEDLREKEPVPTADIEDVKTALRSLRETKGKDICIELLNEFGAEMVSGLEAEKYGDFVARAKGLLS